MKTMPEKLRQVDLRFLDNSAIAFVDEARKQHLIESQYMTPEEAECILECRKVTWLY